MVEKRGKWRIKRGVQSCRYENYVQKEYIVLKRVQMIEGLFFCVNLTSDQTERKQSDDRGYLSGY